MKKHQFKVGATVTAFAVSALSLAVSSAVQAQANEQGIEAPAMEEVMVQGRLRDAAENVVIQRMDAEVAIDIMDAEMIGRIGDSTVSAALSRLPGVTTDRESFVFVRGLGERYSKTLVNGAEVPSPDLSKNAVPLDLFPTSIVKSLSVQKVHSSQMPAHFGGGVVNINTKGIPNDFLLAVQLGSGFHTESTGDFLSYNGGSDDRWGEDDGTRELSSLIQQGLNQYRGDIGVDSIRNLPGNQNMTTEEAELINREFAKALNRNVSFTEDSGGVDMSGEVNLGNLWELGNGMEFGFISGATYDREWRSAEGTNRRFSNPQEFVVFEDVSTYNVDITGHLGLGLRLDDYNSIDTTSLFLRNTDDKVSIIDTFGADDNRPLSEGIGDREYKIRYEQRQLITHQIRGTHEWGESLRDLFNVDALNSLAFADGIKLDWYFSDSTSTTEIPNELSIEAETVANPLTGEAISSSVKAATKANYRFTDLDDELESSGFTVSYPFESGDFIVNLSAGSEYWQKARTYKQIQFAIESDIAPGDPLLSQELSAIYSNENIDNDDLGFDVDSVGSNSESYIAAAKVDALFGKVDVTWAETLRIVAGLRQEDYQQVGLIWDPLDYFNGQISTDPEVLADSVYVTDDEFASVSATWMVDGFWAENFQLRLGFAETTIRPDLREISNSSYVDPLTDATVFGNSSVIPSSVDNYDLRAEWFFENGDNFTVSLFYKDIQNPIEQFEKAAGGTKIAMEIINAESGEMTGMELEFLKNLESFGAAFSPFFLSGNITVLDHELEVGNRADAPTSTTRGFVGAADYTANLVLGFDSEDGMHAATLSFNVSDEKLYVAGRNGTPDAYEQPFGLLNLTYSFYPTDNFTVKLKAQNLLNEDIIIEREGVEVFKEPAGQSFSLSVKYEM